MNKLSSRSRILVAGLFLAACLLALWFSRFGGTYPATATDAAPSEPQGAAAAGGELVDASPALTDRGEPSQPRGVNGTNLYLKASALLKQLSEAERKMIKEPREEVPEAETKALFEKLKPVLALIHEAAGADYYDWGLGEFSFDKRQPQYTIILELARAALWSSAYRFSEDPAGAIEDLAARRQIPSSETNVLIGGLVVSTIESGALEVIRENARHLDASTLERARTFLAESTLNQDVSRAFAGEAALMDPVFNTLSAMSPEERLKYARSLWGTDLGPAAEKVLLDPERLGDEASFIKKIDAQMAEAVTWPDGQFNAWKSQVTERLGDYPFAAKAFPAVTGVRDSIRRVQVEREMLAAGLAILSAGPAAAARARDPGTGNPFSYTTSATGFELRSPTLDKKGKPISMRFAAPK